MPDRQNKGPKGQNIMHPSTMPPSILFYSSVDPSGVGEPLASSSKISTHIKRIYTLYTVKTVVFFLKRSLYKIHRRSNGKSLNY